VRGATEINFSEKITEKGDIEVSLTHRTMLSYGKYKTYHLAYKRLNKVKGCSSISEKEIF